MSHSQFHSIDCLYLDMHGLIFETSVWLLAGSTRLLVPTSWTSSGSFFSRREEEHTSKKHCQHPCWQRRIVYSVWRFELTRFLKLKHTFSNKGLPVLALAHWSTSTAGQHLILVVYLNRSLVAKNNRAKQLNSEFTPGMDWDPLGVEV